MIPIIDLFAGPGGLGEGFSAYRTGMNRRAFKIALSIEKEPRACDTLRLRSFYREYREGLAPEAYYRFLRGEINLDQLFMRCRNAADAAEKLVWEGELGKVAVEEVDSKIRRVVRGEKKWILIGGPPCQAYSIVGRVRMIGEDRKKFEQDERHELYKEYLRILAVHRPPVFVMENVKGLLSAQFNGRNTMHLILGDLRNPVTGAARLPGKNPSYNLHSFAKESSDSEFFGKLECDPSDFVICAENYGIPQARHRVIILGVRSDIKYKPRIVQRGKRQIRMWTAIKDLPRIRAVLSKKGSESTAWHRAIRRIKLDGTFDRKVSATIRRVLSHLNGSLTPGGEFIPSARMPAWNAEWYHDARLGGVCNHSGRAHMMEDFHRYLFVICFASVHGRPPLLEDFPGSLLPHHRNVDEGIRTRLFGDRFRVQMKEFPATTITSHLSKDGHYFIHPDPSQCRSLTVREAARIQSFPDNYFFCGPRTAQYRQVGNAVPPLLASQLAEIVHEVVRHSI